ncbi:MAG: CRISPR-associated endoribonuclease Cas2 [Syntrophomonadaceae bacterium]|nr:CRISPR-associated endoribonuclease Cas2 [Bacillota bacterium]
MKQKRHLYVVYDIKDDKERGNLARRLQYYGLHRVQYSVFDGIVMLEDKKALVDNIKELSIGAEDKIHVLDLCEKCQRDAIIIGKQPGNREHLII